MMLFLHGPSSVINLGNLCLSERKQKEEKKMQSKRPVNLRNVLDSLHLLLYIPSFPSCRPTQASAGLFCLLPSGWTRPMGGTSRRLENGRKVRSGFCFLSSFSQSYSLLKAALLSKVTVPAGALIQMQFFLEFQSPLHLLIPSGCRNKKHLP